MSIHVVTYIRVSSDEQATHGYSIESQRNVLEDYAKGHDLTIEREFVEAESAYKPGRLEFEAMLTYIRKHPSIGAILCYKLDRLARNLTDFARVAEGMDARIISATEELPENATGELMGGVQAVFSRYFSAQLSERVTLGMRTKAGKGIWPSYAPIGYLNDRLEKRIVVDQGRAPIIRELFETYATTNLALSDLASWCGKHGLRGRRGGVLGKSAVRKILSNPFYYGVMRWRGVIYSASHEPLVSKWLFDQVQEKLHRKKTFGQHHEFPYRGLLRCGHCGCVLTASLIKGKYVYYHCTKGHGKCPQVYIRQEKMAELLLSVVEGVQIPEEQVRFLLERIKEGEADREVQAQKRIADLEREVGELKRRRDQAYEDKLDGRISGERWLELERSWSERAAALQEDIKQLSESLRDSPTDAAKEAFELLQAAPFLYAVQKDAERARLLGTLVSNCVVTDVKVEPNYKKPFDLVAEGARTSNWYA